MAKPEWGTKRQCQSCGAKYYDFARTPIVCPACNTTFDPEAILKARRPRPSSQPKKERVVPVPGDEPEEVVEEAAEEVVEEVPAEEAATEEAAEGEELVEEEDELIEDTSELGEDDEDVEDIVEGEAEEEER